MGRLLEAAAVTPVPRGGLPNSIDVLLDRLDDEDRADALLVLKDTINYGHAYVSVLLKKVHGVDITPETVRRYRVKRL